MIVDIQNLEFRWQPDDPPVLRIPALQLAAGEHLFVQGPSGSGKSTLLGLLAGVTTASSGSVRVLDRALEQLGRVERDHFRADHVGYIFQLFNLLPFLSVMDNVLLPCRFSRRRRERARQSAGTLAGEARRLLGQLDLDHPQLHGRAVTTLSVGQQQRVAAARALMGAPELVIADEPTSALDAHRREAFIRLLFDECRRVGATLVFVSHDAALEPLFDRSLTLSGDQQAVAA
ncbi:ABC transporter ATP-binding protein [Thiorhodovibrio frisius]|uniref:ABC-type antimicrobial peptide transport system, ATPase component n=1 Tax=Thiorhodovibrio frisius TaxID=631362 RepID=H8Z8F6_9GAMM|nr:ABC transporter ATP-binding protein [Thiorhodovibrio frisius]EIC19361.1 ABC-type antimicrobial peptide transport system, ATPase component [Thiorhodovibrio frisius]WPL22340.1 putative ABC transporter ATP-binding protein [Thiorhodovibrio frisius]